MDNTRRFLARAERASIAAMAVIAVVVVGASYFSVRATHASSAYDATILADHPVAYWAMNNSASGTEPDLTGTYKGGYSSARRHA